MVNFLELAEMCSFYCEFVISKTRLALQDGVLQKINVQI